MRHGATSGTLARQCRLSLRALVGWATYLSWPKKKLKMDITQLNLFQWCKWLRYLGRTVMFAIVLAIVSLITLATYNAALLPGMRSSSPVVKVSSFLLTFFYSFTVLNLLWSYVATMSTDPGGVPQEWHPFSSDQAEDGVLALENDVQPTDPAIAEQLARRYGDAAYCAESNVHSDPQLSNSFAVMRPRWCKKCQRWKPPRTHHCSISGRCVLKMDHYCVWVSNTVGLLNYKFFLLFLLWSFLGCFMSMIMLLKPTVSFFQQTSPSVTPMLTSFLAFVFSTAFSLALGGFNVMHLRLVAFNMTTIEAYEKRPIRPWPYDKGVKANFEEVFVQTPWKWFVPILSKEEKRGLVLEYLDISVSIPLSWQADLFVADGTELVAQSERLEEV